MSPGDVSMFLNAENCTSVVWERSSGLGLNFYLYHDVNVLPILQQTQVGIEVEPVVLDAGVSQDHLTLPKGLEEDLLPLRPLLCQQLPLKGRHNQRSSI